MLPQKSCESELKSRTLIPVRELISWSVVLVFYGFGLGVLQVPNPKRIIASRVFFTIGAIIAIGAGIMSGISLSDNFWVRSITCFFIFGLIGAGTVEAIRFAGHTEQLEPTGSQKPKGSQNAAPTQTPSIGAASNTTQLSTNELPAPTPTRTEKALQNTQSSSSVTKTRTQQSKDNDLQRRKEQALRDLDYKKPQR
jgi:hypothetical protein